MAEDVVASAARPITETRRGTNKNDRDAPTDNV